MAPPSRRPNLKLSKIIHILMALLIYGVDTESVQCPDTCTCIETLHSYADKSSDLTLPDAGNFTKSNLEENINAYKVILDGVMLNDMKLTSENGALGENVTSAYSSTSSSSSSSSAAASGGYANGKKCSKSTKEIVKDIFVNNMSTKTVNNSKEIRAKRTLKVNVTTTEAGGGAGEKDGQPTGAELSVRRMSQESKPELSKSEVEPVKEGEISTYQITCRQVRDLKPLWLHHLPNSTTRLSIRGTYFQSFKLFQQILRESSVKFSRLTVLSVYDSVINQKSYKKYSYKTSEPSKIEGSSERNPMETGESFLPFASLQNPKLRSKSEVEEFQFKGKFKNVKVLNLVNNTLTFLPQDTFHPYRSLEILNLSNNLIKFIENETFNPLINLIRLDLHKNRLFALHENMFRNLTKLLYLDVSQNSIAELPPSTFQYLSSLNILNLAQNPLSEKEEAAILLGTGKRLQVVDVSNTGLKQIPGTLERSVRVLDMMGNRLLSIRCGDLDGYFLLSYLNLRSNKISYVEDDALGRLELLNVLQISENNLFQIPKSLPNNLEVLNLSYNNIQNITNLDFVNLSLLKELSVSYNQVSNIETNSLNNLLELRVLDLSHNPILVLPNIYNLGKLTNLNLSYFTNIPGGSQIARYKQFPIQSPESIRHLNLESSPLLTAVFLQDTKTLESFAHLEKLDVRFSNLTTMRKDIFSLLPKLRILNVEGNPWHCGKEILILSDWLKTHGNENTSKEEDEINTAHCSTPRYLYKTSLTALKVENFDGTASDSDMSSDSVKSNRTLQPDETPLKGSMNNSKNLDSSRTRFNSTDFPPSERTVTEKELKVEKVNLKKYSKGVAKVKMFLNQKTTGNFDEKSHFPGKSEEKPEGKTSKKKSTVTWTSHMAKRNSTESLPVPEKSGRNVRGDEMGRSKTLEWRTTGSDDAAVKNSPKTTSASVGTMKKAEAVTAKDSLSMEKEYNSHLGFFILSSIGLVVMATLTFTSVYFSRTRRDQSCQRQNQDIEVCSISSIGNELW
ncbi:hypothetical protein RUM43_000608 [Polyplax serrata]|uniref:Insulin-like growth factor-binding protein complex acid labile subunit n=1 Tax=Polyplax serrata TaxID=468196 RepID=A0AAN8SGC3_POLSC